MPFVKGEIFNLKKINERCENLGNLVKFITMHKTLSTFSEESVKLV
jgi:hypothetical protein